MIINTAGEYTLQYTATDACGNSTTVERDLVVEAPPYYGVVWDGSDNPQWTRTGQSASFSDPQPAVNNGTGSSPFDDIMPWSGMQIVEDAEAGTLVSIPKFYYKWIRDELNQGSMELQISMNNLDGFLVSPAHADRGDGVGERDVVYVGRYHCSSVDYKSTSGVLPKVSTTRDVHRTGIHSLGNNVWQNDFAMYWTIRMLYLVEFANWNSQEMIGYGCGSGSSAVNEGSTDSMQYHTGTTASNKQTYGYVQYRHIEGLWSNVIEFVDGIYSDSSNIYAIKKPSDFDDANNGTLIGVSGTTGRIESYFTPTVAGYEYALFPSVTSTSTDYTKYICDTLLKTGSLKVVRVGGCYQSQARNSGLFWIYNGNNVDYGNNITGSRLMKLPSA